MKRSTTDIITGIIIDETTVFSLQEVCSICGVDDATIEEMVAHGLVEPRKEREGASAFDLCELQRLKVALRLQRDLGVNLAGAALAMDLLNELEELRAKITFLTKIIEPPKK